MYKKVLALDCDGTLWKGVVGEDGPLGVEPYADFQKALKQVSNEGVLLVLVSKNNESDVWEVFDKNPNMILTRNDIVDYQICWEEKSETIKSISDNLNLSLDSFVFWDDNPIELEKMGKNTDVIIPNIPEDVALWPDYVKEEFYCDEITEEDKNRISYYRATTKFLNAKTKNTASNNDFLHSINMQAHLVEIKTKEKINRAVQLCAKTNQFNLRTVRHDVEDVNLILENPDNTAFLVSLEDVYGEYGDVGLVICTKISDEECFLDTFLMSCRVMQRNLETYMLFLCCEQLLKKGFKLISAEYKATQRNGPAVNFLSKHSMQKTSNSGDSFFYRGLVKEVLESSAHSKDIFNN